MELHFQKYPEQAAAPVGQTPVIIIPGLFGSTSNWRSFARDLSSDHPVYVIDQRNHGRSPHAKTQSYHDMATDLLAFIEQHAFDKVILCGHSMGGKTAMTFSLLYPERVEKLLVLDIAPVTYTHSHAPFLEELMKVDLHSLNSRREADKALAGAIPELATRMFLLQSLTGSPGKYHWRINLPVLHEYMAEIVSFPQSLSEHSSGVACLFVMGSLSDYVVPEYYPEIEQKFKNVEYAQIADAGHWLHADQPKSLLIAVREFLKK